jgi:hypothetical protein
MYAAAYVAIWHLSNFLFRNYDFLYDESTCYLKKIMFILDFSMDACQLDWVTHIAFVHHVCTETESYC